VLDTLKLGPACKWEVWISGRLCKETDGTDWKT
jgi:hypothetical protein